MKCRHTKSIDAGGSFGPFAEWCPACGALRLMRAGKFGRWQHPPTSWRCFHCGESFTNSAEARSHFGATLCATPICQIDAATIRDMENQLAAYREEDTDLHRRIAQLESAQQIAVRRAEDAGYAKGLNDGQQLVNRQ